MFDIRIFDDANTAVDKAKTIAYDLYNFMRNQHIEKIQARQYTIYCKEFHLTPYNSMTLKVVNTNKLFFRTEFFITYGGIYERDKGINFDNITTFIHVIDAFNDWFQDKEWALKNLERCGKVISEISKE